MIPVFLVHDIYVYMDECRESGSLSLLGASWVQASSGLRAVAVSNALKTATSVEVALSY